MNNSKGTRPSADRALSYEGELMAEGKIGEALAREHWERLGYAVEDVSNSPEYRKLSIDLIARRGDDVVKVEVKKDADARTRGLFCEVGRIWYDADPDELWQVGWSLRCRADVVVYVAEGERELDVVPARELRRLLQALAWQDRGNLEVEKVPSNNQFLTLGTRLPYHWARPSVRVYRVGDPTPLPVPARRSPTVDELLA